MVRAYPPQAFHGDVMYNTNYPPQSNNEGGSSPPSQNHMIFNNTGENMLYNNTVEIMEYNS